jgi:hypothetical protein
LRLTHSWSHDGGGWRHPHVAVIGIMVRRIDVVHVNGNAIVRRV